jgi:drug/metabolite transporter (DMT)-like permease
VIQGAGVDSQTLTSVRCTGTALVLVALLVARRERLPLPRSGREVTMLLGFGITGVALVQWLYFVAIDRLPVGIALLLEFTAPVLVAVFARFVYHERVRRTLWLGLAAAMFGLALVAETWSGFSLDVVGVVAALGAAVSLATYFLLGEKSVTQQSPVQVLTWAFIIASVFWNLLAPSTRLFDFGITDQQSLGGTLASYDVALWVLVTWLVLLGTVAPFTLELSALRHLTATEVTVIGMLEPVGATVLGWLWFREHLSLAQVVGMAVVLLGIAMAQSARIERTAPEPAVVLT